MKRRSFLRILGGAFAIGLAPAMHNVARIPLIVQRTQRFQPLRSDINVSEVSVYGAEGRLYSIVLPEVVTVLSGEELDVTYEVRDDQVDLVHLSIIDKCVGRINI